MLDSLDHNKYALLGGLLALASVGPGALSLDAAKRPTGAQVT